MRTRALRRAVIATIALSLVAATAAMADTVGRDADTLTPGDQGSRDLGAVAPGAAIDVPIVVTLACAGYTHVDPGQSVQVEIWTATVPVGGAIAMDPVTLGPVPDTWPLDGDDCTGSEVPLSADATITITAPSDLGTAEYSVLLDRLPTPAGEFDAWAISDMTGLTFTLVIEAPPAPGDDPPGDDPAPPSDPVVAEFGPPVGSGDLDGRAGRTIPVQVDLWAGDTVVGTGGLVVEVEPCAGGGAIATVEMGWHADSGRWFGLLRTAGLPGGCYRMTALHDGVPAGTAEFRLFDGSGGPTPPTTTRAHAPAPSGGRGH